MALFKAGLNVLCNQLKCCQIQNGAFLGPQCSFDNLNQVRHRTSYKRIRGLPRQPLPFRDTPVPHKYAYNPILPLDGEYTTKRLRIQKLGGRNPETGRVVVTTIGGGIKKSFYWVDYTRHAPPGETVEERVYKVRYDPNKTHLIALVAKGGQKRWIPAAEFTKPGDLIKTINVLPKNPIIGEDGNAHPLGALRPGSLVHNIEMIPGQGASWCQAAGMAATIVRRVKDKIIIKRHEQEAAVHESCMAVVGRNSNPLHYTVNLLVPQRLRWKGRRPNSGYHHKKDGYCGRKLRKPKPLELHERYEKLRCKPNTEYQSLHVL